MKKNVRSESAKLKLNVRKLFLTHFFIVKSCKPLACCKKWLGWEEGQQHENESVKFLISCIFQTGLQA